MTHPSVDAAAEPAGERLSKRLARQLSCSRSEAEQYIAGGFVTVDGQVIESPQFRVIDQTVVLDPKARLGALAPVTLLMHKPADVDLDAVEKLDSNNRWASDRSDLRPLKRHFHQQLCVTPLALEDSGLVVFTQDPRIRRKLLEEAARVEHETMVDVAGDVTPETLATLNGSPVIGGRATLSAKVSVSRRSADLSGLRFAVKGCQPGHIRQLCEFAGLQVVSLRRIRIGRLPLAALPSGQWRYLLGYERF
ncbi:MAG TPA: RNA pseudouridine synthase [Burkholderiaceae bacterium]|jgi:23S rRNA pseudouridine2604 synthase|nr:RNA pseudouridine synthase [Burkholderiaceae bacterium]